MKSLESLLERIRACNHCKDLPLGPRPVIRISETSRVLIVGQAPGTRVHRSGIPWDDPSGDRLRQWLGIDREFFYDESRIAIIPMGLCYPGKAKSGDLPPRRECAPKWFPELYGHLSGIRLTLLIGQYAQAWYLGSEKKKTLTATVGAFEEYLPHFFPLPHPSPRNFMWLQRNDWFEKIVIPRLQAEFQACFDETKPPLGVVAHGAKARGSST